MNKLIAPIFGFLMAVGIFIPEFAAAQAIRPEDCPPILCALTNNEDGIRGAIITLINYLLGFMGLIATIAIIIGGFYYLTSGGDDAGAEQGKNIIKYAAIGIIIILLSYAIVNFLLDALTGQAGD